MDNLIIETQQSYYEYIKTIKNGVKNISKDIYAGQLNTALNNIIDFSEGLTWLLRVEKIMSEKGYIIESATIQAQDLLNEVNSALEKNDYVYVADLFEYEISEIFENVDEWQFVKQN